MLLRTLLFALGIAGLYFGAEWLVRGASRLARALGVGALVVGLTVVAFGTSAPELVVGVLASLRGSADVAIGNVVGSNIVNIALILGVAAMIRPMAVQMKLLLREAPVMIGAALTLPLLGWDGAISRLDGGLLLLGFLAYLAFMARGARTEPEAVQAEFLEWEEQEGTGPNGSRLRDVGLVAVGIVALGVGAELMVGSAVWFARTLGVSEMTIALTVVALGTSLPELATTVVAAARREADIALGNVVGSNIFNSLLILGAAAGARPLAVDPSIWRFEVPVMVGLSLLFVPLALTGRKVERWEGGVLLAGYVAFTVALAVQTGGL